MATARQKLSDFDWTKVYNEKSARHKRSNVELYRKHNTGRFIMFSVITNIYSKKTKGPNLMVLFTATGKLKKFGYRCFGLYRYSLT